MGPGRETVAHDSLRLFSQSVRAVKSESLNVLTAWRSTRDRATKLLSVVPLGRVLRRRGTNGAFYMRYLYTHSRARARGDPAKVDRQDQAGGRSWKWRSNGKRLRSCSTASSLAGRNGN